MTGSLIDRMGDRLGPAIGLAEREIQVQPLVYASEEAAIGQAVAGRQAEFRAGRICARSAMAKIGLPPVAVPVGKDRAPVWPQGVVGSITHDAGLCIAAVAKDIDCRGLGVDLTTEGPLPRGVLEEITSAEERAGLDRMPAELQPLIGRMIFAAKEAAYKAVFPKTGVVWGFDALTVHIDAEAGIFTAETTTTAGPLPAGLILSGHIITEPGLILVGIALPQSLSPL